MDDEQIEGQLRVWMRNKVGYVSEDELRQAAGKAPGEPLPISGVNLGTRDWYSLTKIRDYLRAQES